MRSVPIGLPDDGHPGALLHQDHKKLGRVPDGGGHRVHGRSTWQIGRKGRRGASERAVVEGDIAPSPVSARAWTVSFLVGFAGWLLTGKLVEGAWIYLASVVLGMIAAMVSGRPISLLALWLGMLASYPVAVGLGVFAFLGEEGSWLVTVLQIVVPFGGLTAVGFGSCLVVLRAIR